MTDLLNRISGIIYVLVHVCLMQSCENICIGLKVTLNNVPTHVASVSDIFTWLWITKWPWENICQFII